jgi:chorismate dehydratase
VTLSYDLPSRLADSLAAGRLDIALIPSVEFFRTPGYSIVSDACVACRGPVLSVKLHFRVPPREVKRIALDEGSRTSAALTLILLAEQLGVHPEKEPLPIGCGLETSDADAVLLIGDRAITTGQPRKGTCHAHPDQQAEIRGSAKLAEVNLKSAGMFVEVWDLGEKWTDWTGLPFVFAAWIARPDVDGEEVSRILNAARDAGAQHLQEIAAREAPLLGISTELAAGYLHRNLHFQLGGEEQAGLRKFYDLCVKHGLTPAGLEKSLKAPTKIKA